MKIIICGSQSTGGFIEEMKKASEFLKKKGFEVFTPDCFEKESLVTEDYYKESFGKEKFLRMKPEWTKNHWREIEESDAILIMNHEKNGIKGYIGSNTLMELSVALYLGKKVFLLYPLEEKSPHYEELAGTNSTVINGNLDLIEL
jgi:nucleoside 2-deoxyribosyltransferase